MDSVSPTLGRAGGNYLELTSQDYWRGTLTGRSARPGFALFHEIAPSLPPGRGERSFLEIGCAPGRILADFCKQLEYEAHGIDYAVDAAEIEAFLQRKWTKELDYRLIKEVWAFAGNRIAVRFAYEWRDDSGHWFRSYGNENWEFDAEGLMAVRHASINDLPIAESERLFHWPLGRRPDDHPGLSDLGL